ncbi:hypothetical protein HY622_00365 [Candidatus Uhrbacteria bacterium]|nr:hypothetical protein [Candidatus Uhrbacteria bacterium]
MPHERREPIFVEMRERPYTKYSPEQLLARGYYFIGNRKDDFAGSTPYDKHYYRKERELETVGIQTDNDPSLSYAQTIRNYIHDAIRNGYDVRLARGEYNPTTKTLKQGHGVAVFRRFNLGSFFANKPVSALQKEGYVPVQMEFRFTAWGDHIADPSVFPANMLNTIRKENEALQDFILQRRQQGYHTIIFRGIIDRTGKAEQNAEFVTPFIKKIPKRAR